jgi:hypothetical protein
MAEHRRLDQRRVGGGVRDFGGNVGGGVGEGDGEGVAAFRVTQAIAAAAAISGIAAGRRTYDRR